MKKFRIVLTKNPGEVNQEVIVDIVTNSEPIASVWTKKLCHTWENSDGNACLPDDDGNTEFLDDSHDDVIYLLEYIVLDADEDIGDTVVVDVEEDMPEFEYEAFTLTMLLPEVDPDTE